MKIKPVIAAGFGFRLSELGALELLVEDVKGGRHTIVFMPSALELLRDTIERARAAAPGALVTAADSIPGDASTNARLVAKLAEIERSQEAGYSVALAPAEKLVILRLVQHNGVAAVAAMDPPTAGRLIERLQAAVATIEGEGAARH